MKAQTLFVLLIIGFNAYNIKNMNAIKGDALEELGAMAMKMSDE